MNFQRRTSNIEHRTYIAAIIFIFAFTSCDMDNNQTQSVSVDNLTVQIPSGWQVSKRNTGYQFTTSDLPGVLQVSSNSSFKTQNALENHIKNWPDEFIRMQGAIKGIEKDIQIGDTTGRYIEYRGKDKSNWLSWYLRKGKIFLFITYLSKSPIPEKDKDVIEKILNTIIINNK